MPLTTRPASTSRQAMIRLVSMTDRKNSPESSDPVRPIFPDEIALRTNCPVRPPRKTRHRIHISAAVASTMRNAIGVREINERSRRNASQQSRAVAKLQTIPSHVRRLYTVRREAAALSRPTARGLSVPGASSLESNIHCMPTQMPRNGTPRSMPSQNRVAQSRLFNDRLLPKMADAGQNNLVRLRNFLRIGSDHSLGAEMIQRLLHRGEISGP